jgi:hypothetical protein
MVGTTLTFTKKVAAGKDALNNDTYETTDVAVDDCLIAPITEPVSAREQQAKEQSRDQIRIHMPKASTADVANSNVTWDGKVFKLDSDSTVFMNENTPTRWNRYFRAEAING